MSVDDFLGQFLACFLLSIPHKIQEITIILNNVLLLHLKHKTKKKEDPSLFDTI